MRPNDIDAPYNGVWLSTDANTSPAMVNPKAIYEVGADLGKTITRRDATKFAQELRNEPGYAEAVAKERGAGDYVRKRLLQAGYDTVLHDVAPQVNAAELAKNGETRFLWNGRPFRLQWDRNTKYGVDSLDLYQGLGEGEHITGYFDLNDFMNQANQSEVIAVLDPARAKILKKGPGW